MWFCIYLCQVLLLVTNVVPRRTTENLKLNAYKEPALTDVIRNISKVNDVLQDLMREQKQFEEINKSEGFVDDEDAYSQNEERDEDKEQFDEISKSPGFLDDSEANSDDEESSTNIFNKKTHERKHVPSQTAFHVTRMIMSSEDSEPSSDSASNNNEIDNIGYDEKRTVKMDTHDEIFSHKSDNDELNSPSSFSEESASPENVKSSVNKPEEITFNNTHQATITPSKSKPEKNRGIKTRYKLIEYLGGKLDVQNDSKSLPSTNKPKLVTDATVQPKYSHNKNIKQIVRAETFSQENIWQDITNNKPINLTPETEETHFRSSPKSALVIVTGSKSQIGRDKSERDSALESEEDIAMDKEIFKSKILRQAYGDACLKVVIRKCYKACLSANKDVCSAKNCKRDFKEKFKAASKTGCIKEFWNNTSTKTSNDMNDIFDITRQGYMSSCLPMFKPSENDASPGPFATAGKAKRLNVLRDRYEKECQKVSSDKCTSACKYALKESCAVHQCPQSNKRMFEKSCNTQCKISFRPIGKKQTSRDSSNSGSDSDESDYDSDTDDSDGSSNSS